MALLFALFITGCLFSFSVYVVVKDIFTNPILSRTNVNQRPVATAGGLVFIVALVPIWLVIAWHERSGYQVLSGEYLQAVFLATGTVGLFGVLGLIDDLLASGTERGFRGHLGALRRGQLSTGALKLVAGSMGALALAALWSSGSWWRILLSGAVVALAANLANLFDRAPARVTKVSTLLTVAAVAISLVFSAGSLPEPHAAWGAAALVLGMSWGLLVPELSEKVMLGDTGANPLGATIGLTAVLVAPAAIELGLLVVLLGLNLVSERVSFSKIIAKNKLLNSFDMWGRNSVAPFS